MKRQLRQRIDSYDICSEPRMRSGHQDKPKAHTREPGKKLLTRKSPRFQNGVSVAIHHSHTKKLLDSADVKTHGPNVGNCLVYKSIFQIKLRSMQNWSVSGRMTVM